MDLQLGGKRVVLCGASGVLGRAIARTLAAEGAQVALLGRDLARLQVEAMQRPTNFCAIGCDLSSSTATAHASGWPPNVKPWAYMTSASTIGSATASVKITPPAGA